MASTELCIYCFEVLSARLENRSALKLEQVRELWARYNGDDVAVPLDNNDEAAASSEQSIRETEDEEDINQIPSSKHDLRPRQVSRLQNASSSGSSSASTPSSSSSGTLSSKTSNASSESSLSSLAASGARKEEKYPLFVTWNTINSRGQRSLRGCIGTFEAQPLSSGLREYTLTSAFNDVRFSPISTSELSSLSCDITLLTGFTSCKDPLDWRIGTHGIRISFTHHGRRYGSTYLPQVAPEQGWTKEETMVSLMRKAGWSGRASEWRKVADLKCVKYEGAIADVDYATFKAWRDWVDHLAGEK